MADFSFSFDSDNPFAEPEQAPKKAAPGDEAEGGTPPADQAPTPAADALESPASNDDEFSLDSFDFAFDEDASVNDSLPTRKASLDGAPERQMTPGEAAFAEFDFGADENAVAAHSEAPNTEAPTFDAPEFESPQADLDASEAPETAMPRAAATEAEPIAVEIPEVNASEAETSDVDTSDVDTSEIAIPDFNAFEIEAPEVGTPGVGTPGGEGAEVEVPEFSAFETDVPGAEMPDFGASEAELLETGFSKEVPAASAPASEIPVTEAPASEVEMEDAAPAETSTGDARSDLEEFNAFTYGFVMPDETLGAETDAAESISGEGKAESAVDAPASLDFLDEGAEAEFAPPAPAEIAESNGTKPNEAETDAEVPAVARESSTESSAADVPMVATDSAVEAESQTEGEFRRLKTKTTLSVAVLGASGIGKNHARWFHRHNCRIVGFLGTSPETTTQTEADLSADFDYQGNAYTDLETLLQNERPDIVCVATPPPLHFGHVLQSLESGAHVLCEKPLVYAPTRKFRENRDGAKELVKVAAKRKLNLGTQLQYAGATPILCKLAGLASTDVGDFAMELETTNSHAPRDPHELWIDLGPHPVSIAQMLAGADGQLAEESIVFEPYQDDEKTEVMARFGINCADGRLLMVRAVVRALRGDNPRKPRRRFSFNGHAVTYAPLQSVKNGFQAQFVAPDGYASVYPDPVDYLIGNFVNACRTGEAPMISGDFGRENLEWMLKVGMPSEAR